MGLALKRNLGPLSRYTDLARVRAEAGPALRPVAREGGLLIFENLEELADVRRDVGAVGVAKRRRQGGNREGRRGECEEDGESVVDTNVAGGGNGRTKARAEDREQSDEESGPRGTDGGRAG